MLYFLFKMNRRKYHHTVSKVLKHLLITYNYKNRKKNIAAIYNQGKHLIRH